MWLTNVFAGPLRVLMITLIILLIVKFFFGESTNYLSLLPYISFSYLITVLESVIKIPLMLNKWSIDVYTGMGLLDIDSSPWRLLSMVLHRGLSKGSYTINRAF